MNGKKNIWIKIEITAAILFLIFGLIFGIMFPLSWQWELLMVILGVVFLWDGIDNILEAIER